MYPMDKCHFCSYPLTNYGECYVFPCKIKYQYIVKKLTKYILKDDVIISFKINNYGFEFYNDQTMKILELDKEDIIMAQYTCPEWIIFDKDNYLNIIEKIKKLQVFK